VDLRYRRQQDNGENYITRGVGNARYGRILLVKDLRTIALLLLLLLLLYNVRYIISVLRSFTLAVSDDVCMLAGPRNFPLMIRIPS
jgi:hypothetical protein